MYATNNSNSISWVTGVFIALVLNILTGMMNINDARADAPILVDPRSGKYLGNLSANKLDPDSVNNPLGRYGSPLSPDSINNRLGEYGSPLSDSSVTNPLATNAPIIITAPRRR